MPKRPSRGRRQRDRRIATGQADAVAAQAEAAARAERLRLRKRRRAAAYSLFAAAGIVAASHVLEHLGVIRLFNPTAEDLLLGYPTAGVLAVVGAISLGPGRRLWAHPGGDRGRAMGSTYWPGIAPSCSSRRDWHLLLRLPRAPRERARSSARHST